MSQKCSHKFLTRVKQSCIISHLMAALSDFLKTSSSFENAFWEELCFGGSKATMMHCRERIQHVKGNVTTLGELSMPSVTPEGID